MSLKWKKNVKEERGKARIWKKSSYFTHSFVHIKMSAEKKKDCNALAKQVICQKVG